ncbi:Endonuclease, Uma2 family (restriction endonuclease fold) [Cruoricaptor ignavus]|uniref:Endonuclease, Uma2 family (Restriction endonuclease fold) n=1 Tax=Cruoricaptor ignavus TaxID=1118202 RepID=A0A1M6H8J9_9FLAO|nr:Uma2 family endonuclease [Cruoricaptor ignavus]QOR74480.1 Uma2 family endonuclease [Cruoricaptor ignavus]SHJ18578.1 Endonuclease, Uma2 family (restriction endonuclease fold) [Cruoricaptor ignavus]
MEITDINQLDFGKTYTYADYLTWKFKERVELLNGRIFRMSPAPNRKHQQIAGNLYFKLRSTFANEQCKLYFAPFDVRLPRISKDNQEIITVVQPDICIVCDPNKLDGKGCIGAPDLIIEILSPGNSQKELKNKFDLYEEAGVKEYWLVYPSEESVIINVLEGGAYKTLRPIGDGNVDSPTFSQLSVPLSEIFA